MKKFTQLFLSLSILPFLGVAQITVTQSDFPTAGIRWIDFGDYRIGAHLITPGSANAQTWDYSNSIVVEDTSFTDFVSPSVTPTAYHNAFPNANLAIYDKLDSSATFLKSSASGLYLDGSYDAKIGANTAVMDFVSDRCFIPAPCTLSTTKNITSRITMFGVQGGMPIKIMLAFVQSIKADAFGSLKTPAGTFPNTLRLREMSYQYDSMFANFGTGYTFINYAPPSDTTINYRWLQNGSSSLVMTMDEDAYNLGTSKGLNYYDNNNPVATKNIVKDDAMNFRVSPNPASNTNITFSMDPETADKMIIVNSIGQVIRTENVRNNSKVIMPSEFFENGLYFYNIYDKNGNQIHSGKFSVLK